MEACSQAVLSSDFFFFLKEKKIHVPILFYKLLAMSFFKPVCENLNCVAHGEKLSRRRWWWLGSQADMEVPITPQIHRQGDQPSQGTQDFPVFCIKRSMSWETWCARKSDRWSLYPGAWAQCSYQSK